MGESKSRGELAEIRTTLAALASSGGSSKSETAVTAKRDVFKKIINYITIGIDMSSLFMQVGMQTVKIPASACFQSLALRASLLQGCVQLMHMRPAKVAWS